jgi:hypothetical protein
MPAISVNSDEILNEKGVNQIETPLITGRSPSVVGLS